MVDKQEFLAKRNADSEFTFVSNCNETLSNIVRDFANAYGFNWESQCSNEDLIFASVIIIGNDEEIKDIQGKRESLVREMFKDSPNNWYYGPEYHVDIKDNLDFFKEHNEGESLFSWIDTEYCYYGRTKFVFWTEREFSEKEAMEFLKELTRLAKRILNVEWIDFDKVSHLRLKAIDDLNNMINVHQEKTGLPPLSTIRSVLSSIEFGIQRDVIERYDCEIWNVIAEYDMRSVCAYLLTCNIGFNRLSVDYSPLMIAVNAGNIEIVRMMLLHGWNPNDWTDVDNETPLTIAASKGHKEIFFLLLDNGATLHLIGYDHEMTSDPNGERFEICPEELLVEAIIGRNVEICNYLLSHIDVNIWASMIPRYLKNEEFRDFCLNSGIEALSSSFVATLDAYKARKK